MYSYWRGGRVVECGGLENRITCKGDGGSNPSLSVSSTGLRQTNLESRFLVQKPSFCVVLLNLADTGFGEILQQHHIDRDK